MKGVEISQRTTEKLERETRESIERIRRDFERLAAWILAHRLPRQRGLLKARIADGARLRVNEPGVDRQNSLPNASGLQGSCRDPSRADPG